MRRAFIYNPEKGHWLQFQSPRLSLQTHKSGEVLPLLAEVERLATWKDLYAVGWLSYEAAPGFDQSLRVNPAGSFPLACFGLFSAPVIISHLPAGYFSPVDWEPSITRKTYENAIKVIREKLSSGETYQVNFTWRLKSKTIKDPWGFFLGTCQDAPYAAFLETDGYLICSASPELFFALRGNRIVTRPMKGTAPRGRTPKEDLFNASCLKTSQKNRAENVMIVDMVRNDLGRIASLGSVVCRRLCEIEKYATLWQMTSTVEAKTSAPLGEIFRALFPCASITGAPKVKTMEIIAALEKGPRMIYTGTIGILTPRRKALFNVAIRTVLIERLTQEAVYGVGGGIVWDSNPREEYEECLTKAKIILNPVVNHPFRLLETILWTKEEGFFLESYHLKRLASSAGYFDYAFCRAKIRRCLQEKVAGLSGSAYRIRLLLAKNGELECSADALTPLGQGPFKVNLAKEPVDSRDSILFHKTTRRETYERAAASFPRAHDVILYNENGQVTESTRANVVILKGGRLVTPPVECGLLNGCYRQYLLEKGDIFEEVVTISDLRRAKKIFLINSVRKKWEVILSDCRPLGNDR